MSRITALVGAQFGSEGKGLIAEKICNEYEVHVRTGAPNAGHTYYVDVKDESRPIEGALDAWHTKRVPVVARSVPCGAANTDALLVIGPGGLVDVDLLLEEVDELEMLGLRVRGRIMVDWKAMVIDPVRHHGFEGGVAGDAHAMIGSTGEGVGPARMAKIARGTFNKVGGGPAWALIDQCGSEGVRKRFMAHGIQVTDTARYVNTMIDAGSSVLLEGTQGSGLSLTHGPWPYCTSNDTNAAQLAADAGIAPQLISDAILVARTYPIRVAGNSGPLPFETTWFEVGQPEERTTVTKKVRRVGHWSGTLVRRAVMLNRPSQVALTFCDYVWPELADQDGKSPLPAAVHEWIDRLQADIGVPVTMLGTGPDSIIRTKMSVEIKDSVESLRPWPSDVEAYGV